MGIEVDLKYGGAGSTFFASVIAIEELARVDPSVSVMCDVQNTLVNAYLREFASQEMQAKYFPQLVKDTVSFFFSIWKDIVCASSFCWFVAAETAL